jgi:hypothetical protein
MYVGMIEGKLAMELLADKWVGNIYGTNTGNVFIELAQVGETITGTIRVSDHIHGLIVLDFVGTYSNQIRIRCTAKEPANNVVQTVIDVHAALPSDGSMRGTWHSSVGTAGTLIAYPQLNFNTSNQPIGQTLPEQLFNKNIAIGSTRLFSEDIRKLISFIEEDFGTQKSVVTYDIRGSRATKFSDSFLQDADTLGTINYLKVSIQAPEAYGINKVVVVEFFEHGASEIRVSGIKETWVVGKAESISEFLSPTRNFLVTTYKKYGLNLNSMIFVAMLVLIPEVSNFLNRVMFVLTVFVLLSILYAIHSKFIPNTIIYLTGQRPSVLERSWPTIVSWFVAASSSIFAAWAFKMLSD